MAVEGCKDWQSTTLRNFANVRLHRAGKLMNQLRYTPLQKYSYLLYKSGDSFVQQFCAPSLEGYDRDFREPR